MLERSPRWTVCEVRLTVGLDGMTMMIIARITCVDGFSSPAFLGPKEFGANGCVVALGTAVVSTSTPSLWRVTDTTDALALVQEAVPYGPRDSIAWRWLI